jgi:hypothetical protein
MLNFMDLSTIVYVMHSSASDYFAMKLRHNYL